MFSYTPVYLDNTLGVADNFKARVVRNLHSDYDAEDNPVREVLTSHAVDRTWLITEEIPGGSNATLRVQWNGENELDKFDNTNCVLSHYYNDEWHHGGLPARSEGTIALFNPGRTTGRHFTIYPNPVLADDIFISSGLGTDNLRLTITDMAGLIRYQAVLPAAARDNPIPVNVKTLTGGIYVLRLSDGNYSEQFKLVR